MKVKELLDSPEKWTKEVFARDANGLYTPLTSDAAVSFCLRGAIARCYDGLCGTESTKIESIVHDYILRNYGPTYDDTEDNIGIGVWNNDQNTTFEEVRKLVETLDI